jgi:hypothetical protein
MPLVKLQKHLDKLLPSLFYTLLIITFLAKSPFWFGALFVITGLILIGMQLFLIRRLPDPSLPKHKKH